MVFLERKTALAATLITFALVASPHVVRAGAPSAAGQTLDRLQAVWNALHGYSVMIDAHEVLGDKIDDHQLHYEFAKPQHAELDVVAGSQTGATIVWDGGDRLTFYKRGLSFFKLRAGLHDKAMTSMRGNSIMTGDMGDVLTCFAAHGDALTEADGPDIDGVKTSEIRMTMHGMQCPDDPPGDRNVTLDVIDVSNASGLVLERRRYEGDTLVERWKLSGYKLDPAATPAG